MCLYESAGVCMCANFFGLGLCWYEWLNDFSIKSGGALSKANAVGSPII